MIDPFVAPSRWTSLSEVQRNAEALNARAAEAAAYGLRVGYHNHDHELSSMIDGPPALEASADLLDPSTDQLPAGRGDVPLTEALAAGTAVAYAVIEFDHYEGDIFEGIAESYEFLTSTL